MTEVFQAGNYTVPVQQIPALLSRYQIMEQFLRGIIIDKAIADFTCTEAEHQAAVEQFCQQQQITTPEAQETWLHTQGMTLEQMHNLAVRPILIEKFKQETWGIKVESYFLKRKMNLDMVYYSLIRTQDEGLAKEIYFRIQEGEQTFAELASQFSQGPEKNTGGLVGPAPLTQPHPVIRQLLTLSQPGQLWSPRPLAEWFVIIRLEQLIPAQLDDAMRQRMVDEMLETWLREQLQQAGPLRCHETAAESLLSSSSVVP